MSIVPVTLLTWSPEYALHVAQIDQEHEVFFGFINRLHAALRSGKEQKIVGTLFLEMTRYVWLHFAHEEELMVAVHYPGLREHSHEHDAFRRGAGAFVERHERGKAAMTIELTRFLAGWTKRHFQTADLQLAEYLRTYGGASA